jgi:spore coat protein U-like protein
MNPRLKHRALTVAAVALMSAGAGTAQAATCGLTTTGMAFGNYSASSAGGTASTFTVSCFSLLGGETVNYGVHPDASTGAMGGLGGNLNFALYLDSTYHQPWTSTSTAIFGQFVLSAGQTLTRTFTVYGNAPQGQTVAIGAYLQTATMWLTLN